MDIAVICNIQGVISRISANRIQKKITDGMGNLLFNTTFFTCVYGVRLVRLTDPIRPHNNHHHKGNKIVSK